MINVNNFCCYLLVEKKVVVDPEVVAVPNIIDRLPVRKEVEAETGTRKGDEGMTMKEVPDASVVESIVTRDRHRPHPVTRLPHLRHLPITQVKGHRTRAANRKSARQK